MDDKVYKFENGLPFSNNLLPTLVSLQERVFKNNKAAMIIIDGGVGSGKTTLGVHLADWFNGKEIVFNEQLSMGGEDFIEKLKSCYQKKLPVVVYDEAGDFNRRGALTRFNADLNRLFDMYRVFKIIVILILPSFDDLDESIMKKEIPRILLHCHKRTNTEGHFRGYDLNSAHFIKYRMKTTPVKSWWYYQVEASIIGKFLDLPQKRCDELSRYTARGKIEILETRQLKSQGYITVNEMSKATGVSPDRVRHYLKRVLKIMPVKMAGRGRRLAFYPQEAQEKLNFVILEKEGRLKYE